MLLEERALIAWRIEDMARLLALLTMMALGCAADSAEPDLTGTYAVEWSCIDECPPIGRAPFEYHDRLDIEPGRLLFYRSTCESCVDEVATMAADGCLEAEGIPVGEGFTEPFRLCSDGAIIVWEGGLYRLDPHKPD